MAESLRAPSIAELRERKSTKWRTHPVDVLPLPVAEMDFPIAEPIKIALRDMIDRSDTGYLWQFPELFEAFGDFAEHKWSWRPDPSQMRITTDVGVGVVEVIRTIINPGDSVILNSPVYDNMWRWITEVKAELVDVPLLESGSEYSIDLLALERAYSSGAKVHILCNPHNPVGILFDRQTLESIAKLAKQYGVIVISDEIHGALTCPGKQFIPFLSVSETAREVGITITSASKAFNLAGLKCAMIISGSDPLKERLNALPFSIGFRASLFGAVAATSAFRDSRDWLGSAICALDENRQLVADLIATKIPAIRYRKPDFGFLAWLDLSQLGLGEDPAKVFLEKGRLAINSGLLYGPKHGQFARLNFGTSPEIITDAFDRMARTI
ncbi:MAG: hypothetical protein RLZZ527_737 [Actinomycetota bacterium]